MLFRRGVERQVLLPSFVSSCCRWIVGLVSTSNPTRPMGRIGIDFSSHAFHLFHPSHLVRSLDLVREDLQRRCLGSLLLSVEVPFRPCSSVFLTFTRLSSHVPSCCLCSTGDSIQCLHISTRLDPCLMRRCVVVEVWWTTVETVLNHVSSSWFAAANATREKKLHGRRKVQNKATKKWCRSSGASDER